MSLFIYGSKSCTLCSQLCHNLGLLAEPFEFIDGDDPSNEDILVANNVETFPTVQVKDDDGNIIWQADGDVPLTKILRNVPPRL